MKDIPSLLTPINDWTPVFKTDWWIETKEKGFNIFHLQVSSCDLKKKNTGLLTTFFFSKNLQTV